MLDVTSLIEGPYGALIKLGLAVLFVVGVFGAGYYKGYEHEKTVRDAAVTQKIVVQAKALPAETKVIHDTVTKVQTVHDKVYVYVAKTVPDNRACDLPAATVGVLNSNRALPSAQ